MVQLKGMLQRVFSSIFCFVLLSMCTGCDAKQITHVTDYLRPDLNLNDGIRIFIVENGESGEGDNPNVQLGDKSNVVLSTWSGGSPNTGNFKYTNPMRSEDVKNFVGTPQNMIAATDYGVYLKEQVFDEIRSVIATLSSDVQKKIYLRCGHTGYDLKTGELCKVSGWSDIKVGQDIVSQKVVGGTTLITLATDWVGDLDINVSHKEQQTSYALATIDAYMSEEDMNKNWYQLADSNLPVIYYKMFGRESAAFKTLQEYYDAIKIDPYHNIPNYTLQYYTGTNTTNKMVFNQVGLSIVDQYVEGVPTATVDKLFSTTNQYITRERACIGNMTTDDESILKYYLDGYNKTVIFIGSVPGSNLHNLLGDAVYRKVYKIIQNAYDCIDTGPIKNFKKNHYDDITGELLRTDDYSDFVVIPAGTKGVN